MNDSGGSADVRKAIDVHLADHDGMGAVACALAAVDSGKIGIVALYRDVLAPLLTDTGAAWQAGTAAVWEEHLNTATVRTIVEALYPQVLAERSLAAGTSRSVLLACPPEEHHDLGLRMAADLYALAGWTVHYLGAHTPEEEILDAANQLGVDLVVLTASTHYHRLRLREIVDRISEAVPSAQVRVGGAAFAHDQEGWRDDEIIDLDSLAAEAGDQA